MKHKLCYAPAQRGAGREEEAGGKPGPHSDPSTRGSLAQGQSACSATDPTAVTPTGVVGLSARVRLLTVRPSQKITGSGGVVHVNNRSRTDSLTPPRLGLVRRRTCTQTVFKRQHSPRERTLPHRAECACSATCQRRVFPLLRLRDRDSSFSSPPPPDWS